ncbi:MAG: nuclear transport factor 2 family protein [Pseudosphingobacterium sp.]|nr:nuclear transport factor 2 family protein [Olivibacter sp. UJ_SKK_5.1]MDX3915524.1 nuclear transport factor 2 family protein [Pseudosphingobacterium sp.]
MKTFITSIIAAIVLTGTVAFSATPKPAKRSNIAAINQTLDRYSDAVTNGQLTNIEQLFSEQFHQRIVQRKKGNSFNKKQLVSFLKNQRNVQQNCKTDYSILEENDGVTIAKIEMKYKEFSRIDYVTISQTDQGYQISQVISTFE